MMWSPLYSKDKLDNELPSSRSVESSTLMVRCRKSERNLGNNKQRARSKSSSKDFKCHHCSETGHIKKFCWKLRKEKKGDKSKAKIDGKKKEESGEQSTIGIEELFIIGEEVLNYSYHQSKWEIDSGVTIHCSSRRDFFSSYIPGDFGILRMGNDDSTKNHRQRCV